MSIYDYELTVSVVGGVIQYDLAGGDFTVEGDDEFLILFKRDASQDWDFTEFSIMTMGSAPVVAKNLPVFESSVKGDDILLRDRVWVNGRYKYKYTIKIDDGGTILTSDPEIENIRKSGHQITPGTQP
jgi:hypothetical protein